MVSDKREYTEAEIAAFVKEAMDVSLQAASAVRSGDRQLAADLVKAHHNTLILALQLSDLVVYVHRCWCAITGTEEEGSWRALMADVAEARLRLESET